MYNHKEIEPKWQKIWEEKGVNKTEEISGAREKKAYILDMFPYPSGAGLHVGHPEGYTASDILARKMRMQGYNVLHPMGWDAFGLPAENYAIKTGVHPAESTAKNIETFRKQIKSLGFSYDWDREFSTADPNYYKWTQWIFVELFKNGLAYQAEAPVNWCDSCQTVLANEQVRDGKCERCGSEVVQKNLKQWFFRSTNYIEKLLSGLDKLDWPEKIKTLQRNWIGKSEGAEIIFKGSKNGSDFSIAVFTTRADTLMGASYVVLSPEHPLVDEIVDSSDSVAVKEFKNNAKKKSEMERAESSAEKNGVTTGATVRHPITGDEIPVWIADYVLMGYGTGAVMGVPAHDERDFEFAQKYNLPIKRVIALEASGNIQPVGKAYVESGILVNSGDFDGLTSTEAKIKIIDALTKDGCGKQTVKYHLRDWLISRQRYWGAPIPIIHCESCGAVPVRESDLPVLLPDDVDFLPTGESPLARSKKFQDVKCPKCGERARRESDTMDTFVDSSWYFLRFTDPKNNKVFADAEKIKYWCPIDYYVGGAEHAAGHLIYSRFITKVLNDLGFIDFDEPFLRLRNQGLILGPDGQKMSKSKGNVINPDEIIEQYGADTLRVYEMFMGPFEDNKPWDTKNIVGTRRFLEKVFALKEKAIDEPEKDAGLNTLLHKTIKKVSEDIDAFKFNTAISQMMIMVNAIGEKDFVSRETYNTFVTLLHPFAPHVTSELLPDVSERAWPEFDADLIVDAVATIAVQVNGKLRATIEIVQNVNQDDAIALALANENVKKFLKSGEVKKTIYIPGKTINFVV